MKKMNHFLPFILLVMAVCFTGCELTTYDEVIIVPGGNTGASSSSSSSSGSSIDQSAYFALYSETYNMDVVWDTDIKLDVWQNANGNCVVTEETANCGDGNLCWSFRGTGTWAGVGIRVEPIASAFRDLREYTNGYLVFQFRGPNWRFKIGMEDAVGAQAFVSMSQLTNYGIITNSNWCTVRIPASVFNALNFQYIKQYFIYSSGASEGYMSNVTYYFDNLRFSKTTN